MRWILDACTLIYIVKSESFETFYSLCDFPINIDSSVFEEVVIQGKKYNYQDAFTIEKTLQIHKIPVIQVEIQDYIEILHDPGETSTFVLANEDGVAITSDRRAYSKYQQTNIQVIKLEQFFIHKYLDNKLQKEELLTILSNLERIWAITPKDYLNILSKLNMLEK